MNAQGTSETSDGIDKGARAEIAAVTVGDSVVITVVHAPAAKFDTLAPAGRAIVDGLSFP